MSNASPAVLAVEGSAGVQLVALGANSRVLFVDENGNSLGTLLYFNADSGKIRCNVGALDLDKLGSIVEIDPTDGCIVVDRPT